MFSYLWTATVVARVDLPSSAWTHLRPCKPRLPGSMAKILAVAYWRSMRHAPAKSGLLVVAAVVVVAMQVVAVAAASVVEAEVAAMVVVEAAAAAAAELVVAATAAEVAAAVKSGSVMIAVRVATKVAVVEKIAGNLIKTFLTFRSGTYFRFRFFVFKGVSPHLVNVDFQKNPSFDASAPRPSQ
jgi:hypothetical protein